MSTTVRVQTPPVIRVRPRQGDGAAVRLQLAPTVPTQVRIGVLAPPGPPGPPAPSHEHLQATPSGEWTINHNLGIRPTISLRSLGGVEIEGAITHLSDTQALAQFATPVAGIARCT